MTPFLSRTRTLVLAAAAGFALAPVAFAQQQPAPSDQAVKEQTVRGNDSDRHMAPHDTFYTMDYVSARTDKGVDGFPPGTEVKLVSVNREARTLTVTDGHANIELPPDKLTNDMDIAAMVRAKDAANQESIARYQQAQSEAYQKYQKEVAEYTAKDLEKRQEAIQQANEQRAEQVAENHTTANNQPDVISSSYGNGYYNQGGYGYGSPYSYFVDVNGLNRAANSSTTTQAAANQTQGSNGKGGVSSNQSAPQSGNARTGTTSTSSGAAGGGKAGGKP